MLILNSLANEYPVQFFPQWVQKYAEPNAIYGLRRSFFFCNKIPCPYQVPADFSFCHLGPVFKVVTRRGEFYCTSEGPAPLSTVSEAWIKYSDSIEQFREARRRRTMANEAYKNGTRAVHTPVRSYSRPILNVFACGQVSSPRLYRLTFSMT